MSKNPEYEFPADDAESVGIIKVPDNVRNAAIEEVFGISTKKSSVTDKAIPSSMSESSSMATLSGKPIPRRKFSQSVKKPNFEKGKILKEINDVIAKYGYDVRASEGVVQALAQFMENLYNLSL